MKQLAKRSLALLMALVMCIALLPVVHTHADAATVDYVTDGNIIYNWGKRGATATFLSPKAEEFYTETTYDELAVYPGSSTLSSVPSSALYNALQDLMESNHTHITEYDETRPLYKYTDCENNGNPNTISSFYSGKAIGPAWDSGATWNREHTWPNSKSTSGSKGETARENDIMMLRPTASTENSSRNNKAYGKSSGYFNPNEFTKGNYELRGDVARIVLYVYVRWGGDSTYADGALNFMWGTDGVIESKDVLLEWMAADPVDTWELGRNDSVESITGTRNVFVDYPELAFLLFGAQIPANMVTPSGEATGAGDGHTHSFTSAVTSPASCTEPGTRTYTCTCGASYPETIPATGHSYANGSCTVCGEPEPSMDSNAWVKTELSQITSSDTIAITMTKGSDTWALYNANGTGSAPTAIVVTVSGNTMTAPDNDTISWNITSEASGLIIYKAGSTTSWLYTTGTNNGTRVGNNADKYWVVDSATGYLKHPGTGRYLGVYPTNPDWRAYTNTTGNTVGQTLSFWKLGGGSTPSCEHSWNPATCQAPETCSKCGETRGSVGDHSYVGGVCTVCGEAEPSVGGNTWTKIELNQIVPTDTIAITMTKGSNTWALYNAYGTGNAPKAVVVTVEGTTMTCEDAEVISWNITSDASGLIIYKAGSTTQWLYSTNSNNGVRVGNNADKYWVVDSSSGYLKNTSYNRFMGVYNAQDWRTYTSVHANIAGQTLSFWKLGGGSEETPCEHDWSDATCTAPKTCSICGETEGEALGHSWNNATCTEPKTCSVCGETEGEALGHNYENGSCTVCGAADPNAPAEVKKYYIATKRSSGNYFYMTSNLGTASTKRYQAVDSGLTTLPESITTPKADHVFILEKNEDGTYYIYADGMTNGYLGWSSGNSGALVAKGSAKKLTMTRNNDGSATFSFMNGTEGRYLSLNNQAGNNYFAFYKTGQINKLYLIPVVEGEETPCEHDWTPATCTAPKTCSICGETEGEALGHSWNNATCTTPKTCSVCGETEGEALGHNYENGSCTVCGAADPNAPAEVKKYYIATKRSSGNYFYMTSNLGTASTKRYQAVDSGLTTLPESITTPKADHVFILEKNEDGTYYIYADGMTNGYLGWSSGNSGALVAKGSAKKLTMTRNNDGSATFSFMNGTEGRYLSLNNQAGNNYFAFYKTGQINKLYLIPVVEGAETPCEHDWTPATCTDPATCSKCGETEGEALGHSWNNATCTEPKTCSVCGKTEGEALGHNHISSVTVPPTCTGSGCRVYVCTACGDSYSEIIPATGHNYVGGVCTVCSAFLFMPPQSSITGGTQGGSTGCTGGDGCPLHKFTDVTPGAWYHDGMEYCVNAGLISGLPGNKLAPGGLADRAQIVTMLWRLAGKPVVVADVQYDDMAADSWYTLAVRWATATGITGGYGNGTFGTADSVTREQLVTMLYRMAGSPSVSGSHAARFPDADEVSTWAEDAMNWAISVGVIGGTDSGELNPGGTATRAEVATILMRFAKL